MPPKRKAVFLEENESKKEIKKVSLKLSKKESKKISKKVVEEVDSDDDDEEDDDDDEEEEQPKTKKQKTNAKEGNAKVQTIKKTNLKDKILHLLAKQEKLIGPATIKKILKEEYDVADNKANNTRIAKTLKDLSEEERDDFGKIGGSYHGGETSAAYEDYVKKCEFEKMCKDHLQCPHCDTWNHEDESYIDEDSVARGGVHKCKSCKKRFYTWISDYDRRGHIVEYRYGDGKDDYARRR